MSKVKVPWVTQWVSQWQGHLLSCCGQLKIVKGDGTCACHQYFDTSKDVTLLVQVAEDRWEERRPTPVFVSVPPWLPSQLVPEQAEEREDTLLQPNQDTSASSHICLHTSLLSTNTMRCWTSSDFILTEHTMNLAEYRNPKCLRFKGQPMKPKFSKKILSLNFNLKW